MPGKIVMTKYGQGKLKNEDKPVGDKLLVYFDDGKNRLMRPKDLEPIGFWD